MNRQQRREHIRIIIAGYEQEGVLLEAWLRTEASSEDVEAIYASTRALRPGMTNEEAVEAFNRCKAAAAGATSRWHHWLAQMRKNNQ